MVTYDSSPVNTLPMRAFAFVGALLMAELLLIGTVFKHTIEFNCLANWPQWACAGPSGTMIAIYCIIAALVLLAMVRPAPFQTLVSTAGVRLWPLGLNIAGVVIAMLPITFLKDGVGTAALVPALTSWSVGMALIGVGIALYLAPLGRWLCFLKDVGLSLAVVLAAGAAAPWLAAQVRPFWQLETIAAGTFSAVSWIVTALGYDLEIDVEKKVIGSGDFFISVAPVCSGVEGFALVTVFVSLYLWLFRSELRFPRAFLLYPIGILASGLFNIVRISVLLVIGLEGNPELAVGGFHSHAGWLMFTLVALGIITLAQTVPALQKMSHAPHAATVSGGPPPLFQDPVAAQILPFAIFMLSALLANALTQYPAVVYPARAVLMAGVVALFWRYFASLEWRIDPIAVGAGAAIAAYWIAVPVEASDGPPPYGTLTGAALIGWFVMRGIGTSILVPIIEEVFFRGYLESKLRLGTGIAWKVAAACVTAGLFAALHDRWAEAFVAGLIFSWVALRRGRVTDAIIAHAVANMLIFGVAAATENLALI